MNECVLIIALTRVPGMGSVLIKRLLEHFGNVEDAWRASPRELAKIPGLGRGKAARLFDRANIEQAREEFANAKKLGVRIVCYRNKDYPSALLSLYDPPVLLYTRGEIDKRDQGAIAIVGTRRATHYGKRQAYQLARDLAARGITIVSGLARGIDVAAHQGALDGGGRTIAILGCGLTRIYPPEHSQIAVKIEKNGALVSEYPLNAEPLRHHFPQRNRIISGLSRGVIVVEGGRKSGSLITADCALEQGREVFAVPGEIGRAQTEGPHWLIQQGAKLVAGLDSILEEFPAMTNNIPTSEPPEMSREERMIWEALNHLPRNIEIVTCVTSLPASLVNSNLLNMEIKGMVRALPGRCYVRM